MSKALKILNQAAAIVQKKHSQKKAQPAADADEASEGPGPEDEAAVNPAAKAPRPAKAPKKIIQ